MSLGTDTVTVRCKRCETKVSLASQHLHVGIRCPSCGFTFRVRRPTPPNAHPTEPETAASITTPSPNAVPAVSGVEFSLRSDLVIEEIAEEGVVFFVIKDPVSQRFFRVKPLEHFLVTQFDGKTTFDEIRRRASEDRNVLVGPEVLTKFAQKFVDLGLLERSGQEFGGIPSIGQSRSRLSKILFLKFPLVQPERFLDWLYPWVRWMLTPAFVSLMTLTILFALVVSVVNHENLVFGLGQIASLEGLLLICIAVSAVTVLHELAHGLTCRHFGGKVQDMGFLLMYFVPCFYCNVSDTYVLKEKRQRIWVTFSGGFYELFVWALAVLAWRVTAPEAFMSRVFFIVIAVCGIKSLFNFNPLIKLDGYYMLADYLGVANLRKEALSGVDRFMRRKLLGLDGERPREELVGRQILSMRGDRFVTLFGAAALVYTAGLLGYLLWWSGGWVFEQFGAKGLSVYAVSMLGLLHKPAASAVSSAREVGKDKWEDLGKKNRRSRTVLLWSVVILAIAFFPWPLRIRSELTILPQSRVTVRAPANGRIDQIYFQEGDRVLEGALLLEYDTTALLLEKQTQEAELTKAKEELRLLGKLNPTWQEEISVQERGLETARARERLAKLEFERVQQLWSAGLMAREKFDEAQSTLREAESESRRQEAQVQLTRKGSRTSRNEEMERLHLRDADAQQAVIQRLEAELGRLDDLLSRSHVSALITGTLTTYRFQEKLGEFLEEGDIVCEIVNDDMVVVEMPVPEKEMDIVEMGSPVKFKVRGYPHRSFEAEVGEIAPVAQVTGQISTIMVRATLDNQDHSLKPGMTGVAKIYSGMTVISHVLLRDIVRFIRTEFWL